MAKKSKPLKQKFLKKDRYVVQVRKCLDNGKYDDSVTSWVGGDVASQIYELLEDK